MQDGPDYIIGQDTSLKGVFQVLRKVAASESTVLVTGETGTGKDVMLRALHAMSRRRGGPWAPVNCGAIPADLLESELFGHEKGAYTGAQGMRRGRFESASGGTVFLDEIGDMPPVMQVKLLRVLQERKIVRVGGTAQVPVDVRVVAATHRNLEEEVAAGRFREDLYYRVNVISVHLPPLRDRGDDVFELAEHLLRRYCDQNGRDVPSLSPEVRGVLKDYWWPGNVRELENAMERASILCSGSVVTAADLPPVILDRLAGRRAGGEEPRPAEAPAEPAAGRTAGGPFAWPTLADLADTGLGLKEFLGDIEDRLVSEAMERESGNASSAARLLGVKRTTLVEKLRRRGVCPSQTGTERPDF